MLPPLCYLIVLASSGPAESSPSPRVIRPGAAAPRPRALQRAGDPDREILEGLYAATGGDSWTDRRGWTNATSSVCDWFGVRCADGSESVEWLELPDNNLVGTLPSGVFGLGLLRRLDLDANLALKVTSLEGIEDAASLETLDLSETEVASIAGVGGAPSLRTLNLGGCGLAALPDEVYDLAATLRALSIPSNVDLAGTLSGRIGELTRLTHLDARFCSLKGTIPTEVASLTELGSLDLSENDLSGSIPPAIGSLPNLGSFSCYRRVRRTGRSLDGALPSFADAPLLRTLNLDGNAIEGTIPSDFLNSSDKIIQVRISHNMLTGAVPDEFENLPPLQIEMEGNRITGLPEALCDNAGWMGGGVGSFGCDAILCPPGTAAELGRRTEGGGPCVPCPEAEFYGTVATRDGCSSYPPTSDPDPDPGPAPTPNPTPSAEGPTAPPTWRTSAAREGYRACGAIHIAIGAVLFLVVLA